MEARGTGRRGLLCAAGLLGLAACGAAVRPPSAPGSAGSPSGPPPVRGPGAGTGPALPPSAGAASPVPAAVHEEVAALLAARSRALVAGDVAGVLAGVLGGADPRAGSFAAAQAAAASALADLGVARWDHEVLALRAAAPGDGDLVLDVAVRERLAGEDAPVRSAASYTLVRRAGRWLLAGPGPGPGTPGLWDLGPVRARRTGRALVVAATGAPPGADLDAVAAVCDDAARRVDAAWGGALPRRTTVLVPSTAADTARLLGRAAGTLASFAALAVGDASVPGTGVRVLVQPDVFGGLSGAGRSVVLTHELVHVAARTGAGVRGTGAVPRWLVEGAAYEVARADLARHGPGAAELARLLPEQVRAGCPP